MATRNNIQNKDLFTNVHWLPNLLTTASLFSTFYAILSSIEGQFDTASVAIFIAMIFDTLDGRVARLTKSTSEFGAQYDSLADIVSFGVAPTLLSYNYALSSLGRIGWLVAFIYLVCTALRLARFNTKLTVVDKKFFQGLPCPAAAAVNVSFIWLSYKYNSDIFGLMKWFLLIISMATAALMVSNIGYYSFKDINIKDKSPYIIGFLNALLIMAVAANPPLVLFISFFIYSLTGITYTLVKKHKLRKSRRKSSN